jgi:hypothetical protein
LNKSVCKTPIPSTYINIWSEATPGKRRPGPCWLVWRRQHERYQSMRFILEV